MILPKKKAKQIDPVTRKMTHTLILDLQIMEKIGKSLNIPAFLDPFRIPWFFHGFCV